MRCKSSAYDVAELKHGNSEADFLSGLKEKPKCYLPDINEITQDD